MYLMQSYDNCLDYILEKGIEKKDRTGTGCISVSGLQAIYPLNTGQFPIITGRKVYPKAVFAELLWVLSGSTNNQDLVDLGAKFWTKWCDPENSHYKKLMRTYKYEEGDFGPIYGWQLRHFGANYLEVNRLKKQIKDSKTHIQKDRLQETLDKELLKGKDQLAFMIDILKNDPFGSDGRRCMFSLWNPSDLDKMALCPCHFTYQAIPDGEGGLTGALTQRSADFPIGVPANIQFYSALTIMLAQQSNMFPRELIHNTNDSHIYLDQIEGVEKYLKSKKTDSPNLKINKAKDIYSYKMEDFVLTDYNPSDKIEMPVAV